LYTPLHLTLLFFTRAYTARLTTPCPLTATAAPALPTRAGWTDIPSRLPHQLARIPLDAARVTSYDLQLPFTKLPCRFGSCCYTAVLPYLTTFLGRRHGQTGRTNRRNARTAARKPPLHARLLPYTATLLMPATAPFVHGLLLLPYPVLPAYCLQHPPHLFPRLRPHSPLSTRHPGGFLLCVPVYGVANTCHICRQHLPRLDV